MVTKLIQIGNSRGIRLPKAIIEQAGLKDDVEIVVRDGQVILSPVVDNPRAGWAEAFAKAKEEHGNELTEEDQAWLNAPNEFDEKDWTW